MYIKNNISLILIGKQTNHDLDQPNEARALKPIHFTILCDGQSIRDSKNLFVTNIKIERF